MNYRVKFITITTLIVLVFAWWLLDVAVHRGAQIREKKKELAELNDRFQKLEEMADDLEALKQRFDNAVTNLDSVAIRIPRSDDYVATLEEIRTIAERQGVVIISLSPDREDTFPALKLKLARTGKHVERFPVQINLRGDYLTIGAFLEELLKAQPLINIGSFSLESELDADGEGKMLACALILFTYVYSETV